MIRGEIAMSLHIASLYGSVRETPAGIRVVRYLTAALRRRGHTTAVADAAEQRLPLLDRMYKEYERGNAPAVLEGLAALYRKADAFVIVSGEYNHGIPPALSNLLDHFLEEYFFRPSAIVCYSTGQFGGVRAAMQLRAMLCELGMPSIPSLLPIPRVTEAVSDTGGAEDPHLSKRFDRFADEFEWYARALASAR